MERVWSDLSDWTIFWAWPNLEPYLMFLLLMNIVLLTLHVTLGSYTW